MKSVSALVVAALLVVGPSGALAGRVDEQREVLESICASYRRDAGVNWMTLVTRYQRKWGSLPPPLPANVEHVLLLSVPLDMLCWGVEDWSWYSLTSYPAHGGERCDQPIPRDNPCVALVARRCPSGPDTYGCNDRAVMEHVRCGGPVAAIATAECLLREQWHQATEDASQRGAEERASATPTPREAAVDRWTVQVNATMNPQQAQDLADALRAKGYEAYIVQAPVRGQMWHRVRIGSFTARDEAVTLERRLKVDEGLHNAYVTPQ